MLQPASVDSRLVTHPIPIAYASNAGGASDNSVLGIRATFPFTSRSSNTIFISSGGILKNRNSGEIRSSSQIVHDDGDKSTSRNVPRNDATYR